MTLCPWLLAATEGLCSGPTPLLASPSAAENILRTEGVRTEPITIDGKVQYHDSIDSLGDGCGRGGRVSRTPKRPWITIARARSYVH